MDEAASIRNFERNTKSTTSSTCESNNNISETSLELSKHGTVVYASIITLIDLQFMKTSIEWLLIATTSLTWG